jgi:glycine cleavage system transcriptional repressor
MKEAAVPPTDASRPIVDNHLLVSAIADGGMQLLTQLSKRVVDSGCNLSDARVSMLGREVCVQLLATGSWDAIAKFESALQRMGRDDGLQMQLKRTNARALAGATLPYAVEVIAADKPGILHQLSEFFARRTIMVEALTSNRYKAALTGAEMFQAQITIGIPNTAHIAGLRDDFLEFCDGLNLDAILEPIKG